MEELKPVTLTKKAVEEVKKIMESKEIPEGYALRIGIQGSSGCSGTNFILGFDQKGDSDLVYNIEGVDVLVDKKQTLYVVGLTVDYFSGSDAQGFTFIKKAKDKI